MASKSSITVRILGDAKGINKVLGATSGKMKKFGSAARKSGTVVATGLAAAGGGLLALGTKFDDARDTIITGTGASGKALDGLIKDFEALGKKVPSELGDIGTAVADVNTRLDLTGKPLQDMSERFLNLSRITKTDLSTNIANVSRVFGDAGVATKDQALALDQIFEATKRTGIGLDRLTTLTVNYGAPMRQLGFSFEESLAILGKWEKEGVNIETIMGGMRQGLGKLAKAGEEPAEAFDRIVESIKNASSEGEASKLALEAFGQRAGPDMAAAVREGRFEIGDMVKGLGEAGGALEDATTRTNDWRQNLKVLTNRVLIRLAPIANKVFTGVTKALEKASPFVERFGQVLGEKIPPIMERLRTIFDRVSPVVVDFGRWLGEKIPPLMTRLVSAIRGAIPTIDEVRAAFSRIVASARTFVEWIQANRDVIIGALTGVAVAVGAILIPAFVAWAVAAGAAAIATIAAAAPFVALVAGLAAVGAGLVYAYQNFDSFREVVDDLVVFFKTVIVPGIKKAMADVREIFDSVVAWVRKNWPKIQETIKTVMDAVVAFLKAIVATIEKLWEVFGDTILAQVENVWNTILAVIKSVIKIVQGVIETAMAVITGDWSGAWAGIKKILSGVVDLFAGIIRGALNSAKNVINGAKAGITAAFSAIWDAVKTKVEDVFASIIVAIIGLPGRITAFAGRLLTAGKELGSSIVDGIKDGLNSLANFGGDIARGLVQGIKDGLNKGIDAINNFLPDSIGLGIGPSISLDPNPIPRFHNGTDSVGGFGALRRPAQEIPAILQSGEGVVSRAGMKAIKNGAGTNSAPLLHADNINIYDGSDADELAGNIAMRVAA